MKAMLRRSPGQSVCQIMNSNNSMLNTICPGSIEGRRGILGRNGGESREELKLTASVPNKLALALR